MNMNCTSKSFQCLFFLSWIISTALNAQAYIDFSSYQQNGLWSSSQNEWTVVGGETYILQESELNTANLPVVNGQAWHGGRDLHLTKIDALGNVVYATYVGGAGNESQFIGDFLFRVVDGEVYIVAETNSTDLPVTNGTSPTKLFYARLDATTGQVDALTYLPIANIVFFGTGSFLEVKNDFVYVIGNNSQIDVYCQKLDKDGNIIYLTTIGPAASLHHDIAIQAMDVDALGRMHFVGYSESDLYPVTATGHPRTAAVGSRETFYTRLGADGAIEFSTYLGSDGYLMDILSEGGFTHILQNSLGTYYNSAYASTNGSSPEGVAPLQYLRFDESDNAVTSSYLNGDAGPWGYGFKNGMVVYNDVVHCALFGPELEGATANVVPGSAGSKTYLTQIDALSGNLLQAVTLPGGGSVFFEPDGTKHFMLVSENPNLPVVGGWASQGESDAYYLQLNTSGDICYASYLGGGGADFDLFGALARNMLVVENDLLYFFSATGEYLGNPLYVNGSADYPTTDNSSLFMGESDYMLTRLAFCPPNLSASATALTPATQDVCQNGVVDIIRGDEVLFTSPDIPQIYRDGMAEEQYLKATAYQWQEAASSGGPWTDIPGAIAEDYQPDPLVSTTYFRRIARIGGDCCPDVTESISAVASVMVNGFVAPQVNAGGIYNTCPATSVTLDATVSGGTGPGTYTYDWDMGASDIEDPVVTVSEATVFTVIVTDGNNCKHLDQAVVTPYTADAGSDTAGFCDGEAVQIGGQPLPASINATYAWSPVTNLSCTDCPNPLATPAASTTYSLEVTIPITGGGTCMTTDMITVNPVAPPGNPNFGGADVTICRGDTAPMGTPAEAGFSYTWAPGNYLPDNHVAEPIFTPGSLSLPNPDPILYYVTAEKEGCTFTDEVLAYVIEADAWIDGCGPRYIGVGDNTPDIAETYEWVKISGPATFTGPTDQARTTVSESLGSNSVFELRTTFNGVTCTDQVIVTPPCECNVDVVVESPFFCPDFDLNGGDVVLHARGYSSQLIPENSYIFNWEVISGPAGGLNTFTGADVQLTDNQHRTYRVTITSTVNPNFSCFYDIEVNAPAWSLPVFSAADVSGCALDPLAIGAPPVTDYTYFWSPETGLDDHTISMPTAMVPNSTDYTVRVTDTRSGCVITDDVLVETLNISANAGPDQWVCDNGTITLGGLASYPDATVQWSPSDANWQNGTGPNDPQPEVLVAIDQVFRLTVTTNSGSCVSKDSALVRVGALPAPFGLPDINYCPSDGPVTLGSTVPTGYSYRWFPSELIGGGFFGLTSRSPSTIDPPPSSATTFTLRLSDGGCSYTTTQTIVPSVGPPDAGADELLCADEVVTIGSAANPTGAGITYNWTGTGLAALSSTTSPNPIFNAALVGAGEYSLTLSKEEGACTSTDEIIVTVLEPVIPALPSETVCQGGAVKVDVVPQLGTSYHWEPTTGVSDPNIANPLISNLTASTTYTVTGVNSYGCTTIRDLHIDVLPLPAPSLTLNDIDACLGDDNVFLDLTVSGGTGPYAYLWSPNDGSLSSIYTEDPEVFISTLGTKTYGVTITDSDNGCQSFDEAQVSVVSCAMRPPCEITAINFSNTSACVDEGAIDYFTADITVSFSSIPLTGNLVLSGDVIDVSGSTVVAVGDLDGPTSHVFTGIRLLADGTPSEVTASFSDDSACSFSVFNGPGVQACTSTCPAPPSVVITQPNVDVCGTMAATFDYTVANGPASVSHDGTGTLSISSLANGTSTFTYTPAAADAGNTVTITANIADTDGTGPCEAVSDMATVTVNPNPTMTGGMVCVGDMITLTGSGTPNGTSPYVSDNMSVAIVTDGGAVTGVSAGTATITYTDINSCTVMATVTVNAVPDLSVTSPITNSCPATTVDLTDVSVTGLADGNSTVGTISYHTV